MNACEKLDRSLNPSRSATSVSVSRASPSSARNVVPSSCSRRFSLRALVFISRAMSSSENGGAPGVEPRQSRIIAAAPTSARRSASRAARWHVFHLRSARDALHTLAAFAQERVVALP
ncbi:hypothetical protein WI81_04965 [Burkholderia ubonensis]|nr:hypothetical protein WI81_04965 [Burkholderia ubonensis]